jgi:hypothetical protein
MCADERRRSGPGSSRFGNGGLLSSGDLRCSAAATEWPVYLAISTEQLLQCSDCLVVLDANRFLPHFGANEGRLRYFVGGMPS